MISTRHAVIIALIVALTGVIVWSVWTNLRTYLYNDHLVVISKQQLWDLQRLRTTLEAAETGQRGYLLRQQPEYLRPYQEAISQIDARIADVERDAVGEEQIAIEELKTIIHERARILKQTVELAGKGDVAGALAVVETDRGQKLMSEIRSQLDAMLLAARDRFTARLEECKRSTKVMTWTVGACALALVVMSVITIQVLARANAKLAALNATITESNRLREGFFSVLSHELRAPLTPALLTASALEMEAEDGSERKESLTLLRQSIEMETRLIDDLLDISRARNGKLRLDRRPITLRDAIEPVINLCKTMAAEAGLTLTTDLCMDDKLSADLSRLQQLCMNLLSNAIKFTPRGGSITLRSRRDGGRVFVTVKDTGCGIDPSELHKIFRPFEQIDPKVTRSTGGLGLGLAIAKAIVELHGGFISVESAGKGHGSMFTVVLPGA